MAGSKTTTWILIADGEHARVVVPAAGRQFRTISSLDSATAHRRSADLGTGEPGRSYESASPARHAIEPKSDPHRLAKQSFARYLADQMNAAAAESRYDHLVLVAPTSALRDLREALGRKAKARLAGALARDIVKVADADLEQHLEAFWRLPGQAA
jgi:protein required for attachment to host cells